MTLPVGHRPLCRAQHMAVNDDIEDLDGCDCPLIDRVAEDIAQAIEAEHGNAPSTYWDDALDEAADLARSFKEASDD